MFENLNRYSEILLLTTVIILPLCHFLDKEGYHFTWSWFKSKIWTVTFLSIAIEIVEAACLLYSRFYRKPPRNEDFDAPQTQENPIPSPMDLGEFKFQLFTKAYNILILNLVYDFAAAVIDGDFSYKNSLFDRLFVLSVFLFLMKVCMIHKTNSPKPASIIKSTDFAFFCFNLMTNLFLILLTLNDRNRESLVGYLQNLKYRDIEDVAWFLEFVNIFVILRLILFGINFQKRWVIFLGITLMFKLFFMNENSFINVITYLGVPLINGLIHFDFFNKEGTQEFIQQKLIDLFRRSEDKILGI